MKHKLSVWAAVVFVSALLFAISGLGQEKSSLPDEVAGAVGSVRTINTAEVTYASTYTTGYSRTLAEMGETATGVKESPSRANLIDNELAQGRKHGYVFTYRPGKKDKDGKISNYTVTARPIKWHKDAVSFFTDQTGVIRWTRENRAPTAKDDTIDSLVGK
jgi:type IV pilus assembly protein PilA